MHYPIPLPRQAAFAGDSPRRVPDRRSRLREVCSLPLHPQLPDADVDVVAAAVLAYRGARGSLVSGVQ